MKNKATRFVLYNLLILTLILPVLFFLIPASPVIAATINVPADQSTIQAAINAASPGDTINVAAGTYPENLAVNKSLTLHGASSATVIVTAADPLVSVFTVTASNVNISGFTATGTQMSGNNGYAGIYFAAGVTNCNIHDNVVSTNQYGILMLGTLGDTTLGNNIFTNNTASNCVVSGIEMQNTNGNTFTNNTANSNGAQGFRLANSKNNTFTGNIANLNLGPTAAGFFLVVAGGTGSNNNTFINNQANSNVSHGLRIDGSTGNMLTGNTFSLNTFDGIKLKAGSINTTMNNNSCSLNDIGIDIAEAGIDATSETLSNNNITGNHTYGVRNLGTGILNAKFNYWNNLSGPSHDGLSYGDSVSANVNFQPWLIQAAATAPTLAITTAALPGGALGVPYSQALAATGGTPPYQWAQYANFPAWLSISAGGVLSGTPPTTGPFDFQVQVRDTSRGIWKAFHLGISTTALTITTTSPLPTVDVGFSYSQTLQASGGSGSYSWTLFSGSLPPGLDPITSGGLISGIPTTGGTYPFTVQVNDGLTTVNKDLSITVSTVPLNITTLSLPAGNVGTPYSQTVLASGGSGSYTFSLFSGSLPPGLGPVTSGGLISGTPTTIGTPNFTVRVNDGYMTHDQGLSITINGTLVKVTTTALAAGNIGIAYSQTLQASGGSGSYSWTLFSGSLPPGLGPITSGGLISGTPTTGGTYDFTVQVNDGITTDTKPLSITITLEQKLVGADDAAAVNPVGNNYLVLDRWAAVATGSLFNIRVKCTAPGSVKVALYTDSAGSPGTLIIANDTGTSCVAGWNIINIPLTQVTIGTNYWIAYNSSANCVGYYSSPGGGLVYRALDYASTFPASAGTGFTTATNNHSLTAAWGTVGPVPLIITTTSLPGGQVGVSYSQTLQATGGTPPYTYTWSVTSGSLPPGLGPLTSAGLIAGTPTTAGTSSFTVQVNDGSTTVTQPLSITITNFQKLFGQDDAATTTPAGGNFLVMDKFTAALTGNVTQIRVKCTASGNVMVALYADNAGSPGALINANNAGAGCIAGWNNISLPLTSVTSGTDYWIAYNSDANCVGYMTSPGGGAVFRAFSFPTTFPASAGAGFTTSTNNHSLTAAWGSVGPALLTITTTSLPDGTVGVLYSQTLHAIGGTGSYTWSIPIGSLPTGLPPISSGGLISGTPTTAATYNFTAQVDDGSTIVTQLLSITITNLQKLLGQDDAGALGPVGGNFLIMDRSAAVNTGSVTQIRVKCTGAGNVKVALYADNAGSPGTRLNANNTGAAVVAGWNNISLPATSVFAGTNYWIAYDSTTNCVGYITSPGGGLVFRALSFPTTFPDSAGTGFTTSTNNHSLTAGWGEAGPIALAVTTTSLPDGGISVPYSQTLQAMGGTPPYTYTWSITSGSLPAGLGPLTSGGLIAGTPTTAGTSSFTVQVDDGSTTASMPLSITITNFQKLFGQDDAVAVGSAGSNFLVMDSYNSPLTGSVNAIKVKCTDAGTVRVALYTDNAGSPGTLINANNIGAAVVPGWNNIDLPSTAVTSGATYWIAYDSSTNCVGYITVPGGGAVFKPLNFGLVFPATAGTGFTTSTNNHSLTAGWGSVE